MFVSIEMMMMRERERERERERMHLFNTVQHCSTLFNAQQHSTFKRTLVELSVVLIVVDAEKELPECWKGTAAISNVNLLRCVRIFLISPFHHNI